MTELDIVFATGKPYGIDEALSIYTSKVDIRHSLPVRCQFGCEHFGQNWSCPPRSIDFEKTKALLLEYKRAILVIGKEGKMDLKTFREAMVDIEQKLILNDFPKAFALVNGPCLLCDVCTVKEGKPCRFPDKLRPSLEGTGIDIVSTARKFKRNIDQPIKGIRFPSLGLILLE
ncbi:MAG TPA: DUF2284 domain-containing protein [Candidatus Nanoarchaeia archaeon]|nr:DUF2284 domain-containing protein [Candidatus Nanoarchaeia archaeon]